VIPGKKYTPDDIFAIAWRRKWMILVPWVLITIGTIGVSRVLPDVYKADTLIQIVPQRLPESFVRSTVTTRVEDRLQALRQDVLNRTRLERLIDDFKLYPRERTNWIMEDVVERMRRDIGIDVVKGDSFRVSYLSESAQVAMKVTERLASVIIEENLRDRESLAEGANQFFETQLEDARRRLEEHEKSLEEYRRRNLGELPSQMESNLQVVKNVQEQVQGLAESINRDRDRRLLLERLIGDLTNPATKPALAPSADPTAISTGSATERLAAARDALRSLELRLKPEHPDVVRMKRLIGELELKADAEPVPSPTSDARVASVEATQNPRVREMQLEIENIDRSIKYKEGETDRLRGVIAMYQSRIDVTPARESELIALTRDYETLQKVYTSLLSKKEDTKVAANLERRQIGEQFKVLEPARLPEKPFSPDRGRINTLGTLGGLIFGLALVTLLEYRDSTLRSDEDVVASLSLTVLAMIPQVTTTAERSVIRHRRLAVSLSVATGLCLGALALIWKLTTS
jgi:polysaccharide chain length determinant protein (PEP-CTERM system associated)